MRNLLKFFLFNCPELVFGLDEQKSNTVQLTTADYVMALEIISEFESIPDGFLEIAAIIVHDELGVGYHRMWEPSYARRTGSAMKAVLAKALRNPYPKSTQTFAETEARLAKLRKISPDYTSFPACVDFVSKIQASEKAPEPGKWHRVRVLQDAVPA